ncbi:glutathione reductase (NADPH) [Desulfonatronum thiosulfatophilum]|uniref:Glutathione reductase (NADPH) n=1 Tax=Desulfonatronum thiosulfatophilum TaxID=617002 RepID=A0A1G6B7F9_9BACT|nr:NAD(P)/FAD-dependent oxidoreductase [Desulfonatronum thiosulfatophilum]SDB16551.1 glutathione reductase (NADPH) [Desulfonatronum thiosulfatophilum]
MEHFDVIVIGSGTAGYTAAHACRKAGRSVLVVDKQPFGGTCAMRGCQPKKILVAAAQAIHGTSALHGQGVDGESRLDWAALMRFKRDFTYSVPERSEQGFLDAGIRTAHGLAVFSGPNQIRIEKKGYSADKFIIAAGAVPRKLSVPGNELLMDSDGFLELDALPSSIAFIGGGFISFEFAHVCAQAGVRTTMIHRGKSFLRGFDPDLVTRLMEAGQAQGISFLRESSVKQIDQDEGGLTLHISGSDQQTLSVDKAVAAIGRVPDLADLGLDSAGVEHTPRGIKVNSFMQTSNPSIYAVGDVADTQHLLSPTADMEANTAASNILRGNSVHADYTAIPSVVFSIPALAAVGMSEEQAHAHAEQEGIQLMVNAGDASEWMSSRRIGQKHAAYKVILNESTGTILGAHILGHNAGEMINIFAMAMKFGLTREQLKSLLWAYPTHISDIKYML